MPSEAAVDRMLSTFRELGLDWLLTVPSTGLQRLYGSYESIGRCLYATREEEAIALAAGLRLGGAFPVVVMQQTGVGNAINAVLSLADAYGIGFPVVVLDRTVDDPNLVQRVSSGGTARVLSALGCIEIDWELPDQAHRMRTCIEDDIRWILCPMVGSG